MTPDTTSAESRGFRALPCASITDPWAAERACRNVAVIDRIDESERGREMLTDQQKRELTIDTMASWALEGMKPDRATVDDINAYLSGDMTRDEFVQKSKTA